MATREIKYTESFTKMPPTKSVIASLPPLHITHGFCIECGNSFSLLVLKDGCCRRCHKFDCIKCHKVSTGFGPVCGRETCNPTKMPNTPGFYCVKCSKWSLGKSPNSTCGRPSCAPVSKKPMHNPYAFPVYACAGCGQPTLKSCVCTRADCPLTLAIEHIAVAFGRTVQI